MRNTFLKSVAAMSLTIAMVAMPLSSLAQTGKEYVGDDELRVPECKISAPLKSLHLENWRLLCFWCQRSGLWRYYRLARRGKKKSDLG